MIHLWPDGELIEVLYDDAELFSAFTWRGRRHAVRGIARHWQVDEGWWRQRIWREYYKLYTDTGLLAIVYRDLLSGQWYLQSLYD